MFSQLSHCIGRAFARNHPIHPLRGEERGKGRADSAPEKHVHAKQLPCSPRVDEFRLFRNYVRRPGRLMFRGNVAPHRRQLLHATVPPWRDQTWQRRGADTRFRNSAIKTRAGDRRPRRGPRRRLTSVCWDSSPSGFAGFSFGLGFSTRLPVSSSFLATSSVVVNFLPLAFFRSFLAKKSSRSAMATRRSPDGAARGDRGAKGSLATCERACGHRRAENTLDHGLIVASAVARPHGLVSAGSTAAPTRESSARLNARGRARTSSGRDSSSRDGDDISARTALSSPSDRRDAK